MAGKRRHQVRRYPRGISYHLAHPVRRIPIQPLLVDGRLPIWQMPGRHATRHVLQDFPIDCLDQSLVLREDSILHPEQRTTIQRLIGN